MAMRSGPFQQVDHAPQQRGPPRRRTRRPGGTRAAPTGRDHPREPERDGEDHGQGREHDGGQADAAGGDQGRDRDRLDDPQLQVLHGDDVGDDAGQEVSPAPRAQPCGSQGMSWS